MATCFFVTVCLFEVHARFTKLFDPKNLAVLNVHIMKCIELAFYFKTLDSYDFSSLTTDNTRWMKTTLLQSGIVTCRYVREVWLQWALTLLFERVHPLYANRRVGNCTITALV